MLQMNYFSKLAFASAVIIGLFYPLNAEASSYCPEAEWAAMDLCVSLKNAAEDAANAFANAGVISENDRWNSLTPEQQDAEGALANHAEIIAGILSALLLVMQAILEAFAACLAAADLIC